MTTTPALPIVEHPDAIKPRCHVPWQQMVVDSGGDVMPCCYWRAYGNSNPILGNVNEKSLEEIWNDEGYRELRRHMAADDLKSAGCQNCHALHQGHAMDLVFDADSDAEADLPEDEKTPYRRNLETLRAEIARGETRLEAKPTVISLTPSHRCNIRCTHCYQESSRDLDLRREEVTEEFFELTDTLTRLVAGGGEPFLLPIWRRFLAEFDHARNPYLDFATTTNATILTKDVEHALRGFKAVTLNVSMDGTGEAFERVRRGAKFDEVAANVRRLAEIARDSASADSSCGVSMCVMKSNLVDLPNFIRFATNARITWGMSPVVTSPPDESIACFNDPVREMAGWREAIAEARVVTRDEYNRMVAELSGNTYDPNHLAREFDLLEQYVPWSLLDVPHHRVRVDVPDWVVETFRTESRIDGQPMAYIYPRDNHFNPARYCAWLKSGEPTADLPILEQPGSKSDEPAGPHWFEVSLPLGSYEVSFSSKWVDPRPREAGGFVVTDSAAVTRTFWRRSAHRFTVRALRWLGRRVKSADRSMAPM